MKQITDTVLMVRPAGFGYNAETAANNFFQQEPDLPAADLQRQALLQFDAMVEKLRANKIQVIVINDTPHPPKPDALFPNNWFSAVKETITVFPMFAENRRREKRADIIEQLSSSYRVAEVADLSHFEVAGQFLEGTGSMVMDHVNRIIYACLSPRTHREALEQYAAATAYRLIAFSAHDAAQRPIYHTNVMLCIGEGFAVLCADAITNGDERMQLQQLLSATNHEIISIDQQQMAAYAGNMLHLQNKSGEKFIVLSASAHAALTPAQITRLQKFGNLLPIDVSLIEQVEGGSVRCMMAEIFLDPK